MSPDTKYQVMGELLGIHAAAIEKAEEQAGRIIGIVQGGWTKEAIDECAFPPGFAESLKVQVSREFTPEDLSYLKDRGHTWAEIGAEAGISQDAARKRVCKWRAKQPKATRTSIGTLHEKENCKYELIEAGAEETRQEAEAAEATIRKSLTVEEQIGQFIRCMILKDPNAMDFDILQAVKRNFPGISISVADIRSRRGIA